MGNFREKLIRFMYGRYGIDSLYYGLFALFFIVIILSSIIGSVILTTISWLILFLMLFRMMSRNVVKRRAENEKFMKFWRPVRGWFKSTFGKLRDFHKKVYRRCPSCKSVLRLPYKRGSHSVECPRCRNNFKVKVWL